MLNADAGCVRHVRRSNVAQAMIIFCVFCMVVLLVVGVYIFLMWFWDVLGEGGQQAPPEYRMFPACSTLGLVTLRGLISSAR